MSKSTIIAKPGRHERVKAELEKRVDITLAEARSRASKSHHFLVAGKHDLA